MHTRANHITPPENAVVHELLFRLLMGLSIVAIGLGFLESIALVG